jgi:Co/Zn/Cd efflux system component
MLVFGLGVLGEAIYKMLYPVMPGVETMGVIGGLALVANLLCFFLLYRHRSDNLNLRSTWLCSRNDVIANAGVLVAAAWSYALTSAWPDIVVGTLIASVFLRSAWHVVQQARQAIRQPLHIVTVPHA